MHSLMEDIDLKLFFSDCPATPAGHTGILEKREIRKSVTLYLTHACNLRCLTCYLNAGDPLINELNTNDYRKLFPSLKELGFDMVYLLGGEPMLRKDIFEIISSAKENDLIVSMSSNGFFIDNENARKLSESGLDNIQISIDSADERINDTIRGRESFRKAKEAIINLKNYGMKLSIAFVITRFYNDINEIINMAKSLNVDAVNISVAEPFGRALKFNVLPTREMVKEAIMKIENLKNEIEMSFNGFRFYMDKEIFEKSLHNIPPGYFSCPAGRERFVIDSNGDVYGCELMMDKNFLEGNIRKVDVNEIWFNGFKFFRERKLPENCRKCNFRESCQGGCPARSFISNYFLKDPLCKL